MIDGSCLIYAGLDTFFGTFNVSVYEMSLFFCCFTLVYMYEAEQHQGSKRPVSP